MNAFTSFAVSIAAAVGTLVLVTVTAPAKVGCGIDGVDPQRVAAVSVLSAEPAQVLK